MIRSDELEWEARVRLAEIRSSLENLNLGSTIDTPIDMVVDRICEKAERTNSPPNLQELVAQLLAEAFRNGPPQLVHLPRDQALAEAILILERGYAGTRGRGYHAALVDSRAHPNGVAYVLRWLGETLKSRFRAVATERAVTRVIDRCSWELKCAAVYCLQVEYGIDLPDAVRRGPSEQFVGQVGQLVVQLHGV